MRWCPWGHTGERLQSCNSGGVLFWAYCVGLLICQTTCKCSNQLQMPKQKERMRWCIPRVPPPSWRKKPTDLVYWILVVLSRKKQGLGMKKRPRKGSFSLSWYYGNNCTQMKQPKNAEISGDFAWKMGFFLYTIFRKTGLTKSPLPWYNGNCLENQKYTKKEAFVIGILGQNDRYPFDNRIAWKWWFVKRKAKILFL